MVGATCGEGCRTRQNARPVTCPGEPEPNHSEATHESMLGRSVHILEAWKEGHKGKDGAEFCSQSAQERYETFREVFQEVHGQDTEPTSKLLDPELLIITGEGKGHGRHLLCNGAIVTSFATGRSLPPRIASSTRYARRSQAQLRPYGVARPPRHVRSHVSRIYLNNGLLKRSKGGKLRSKGARLRRRKERRRAQQRMKGSSFSRKN